MSKKRVRKKGNNADFEPSGVIIYDPEKDPSGEKAAQEYYRKYPEYANDSDGNLILLPEIEKLPDDE